jgi:uncharacterized protein (TIRG00374 family)
MIVAELGSLWCLWRLQAICMDRAPLRSVATAQLSSSALSNVVPGGAATAAAAEYAMLGSAGVPHEAVALGLAASGVLQLAALCALPLLIVPLLATGLRIPHALLPGLLAGAGMFVAMFAIAFAVVRVDGVLRGVARAARSLMRRLGRRSDQLDALPERVVAQRDRMVALLGRRWLGSLAAAVGRWLLDFAALVAALAASGTHPRLSLTLLAYVGAQLLAQIPVSPGGLGVVEAGLTGLLVAAGTSAGQAAVATLAYRLVAYWMILPLGLVAWLLYRSDRRAAASAEAEETSASPAPR